MANMAYYRISQEGRAMKHWPISGKILNGSDQAANYSAQDFNA